MNIQIGHNIKNEIDLIIHNIPDDLTEEEKLRWIYIKMGNLFSYDYRVANNIEIGSTKVDFDSDFISNYQICSQICEIMNKVFEMVGIKSKTFPLKSAKNLYDIDHTANEIELNTGEKYIIDLTLDLYLIQSGCMTKYFGQMTVDGYDTFSTSKLESIDEKLHLIKYGEYMDKRILDKKSVINGKKYDGLTDDEKLIRKMEQINEIMPTFQGYNESRLFGDKLLNDFGFIFNRYNLTHKKSDKFIGCFQLLGDNNIWYLYIHNIGFIKTNARKLKSMVENGWTCKKESFYSVVDEELSMHL